MALLARNLPVLLLALGSAGLLAGCSSGGTESAAAPRPQPDKSTLRATSAGAVIGFAGAHESHAWLGLPYAQPPVGARRWRAPQKQLAWSGAREATAFGSPCTQYASPIGGGDAPPGSRLGGEDCLYLNVWAPRFAPDEVPGGDERLPVMVWIHGGGNTIGHGGFYDGAHLAASQQLIVLTVNYRLGALGWFDHAAIANQSANPEDASGNYGTLDLIEVLRWVRDNVAVFGGDPDNVTIFGESAGGTNVMSLLVSPLARGLFDRAVVQSGGVHSVTRDHARDLSDALVAGDSNSSGEVMLRLLQNDGQAADRVAAIARAEQMDASFTASYLRDKSGWELLEAYDGRFAGMYRTPGHVRDGHVLPQDDPLQLLADGRYQRVPTILGTNRDEDKLFMFADPEQVTRLFGIPLWIKDPELYNLRAEYGARMAKASGADELAMRLRRVQGPSVYVYRWDWDEEPRVLLADLSEMLGAAHGLEIPFVFGHFELGRAGNVLFDEENLEGRVALSNAMMSYWGEFAWNGDPARGGGDSLPRWTAWDDGATYLVLDTDADGGIRMASDIVTSESVLAELDRDPRLADPALRCDILLGLARWSDGLSEEDYETGLGCEDYPADAYPWN